MRRWQILPVMALLAATACASSDGGKTAARGSTRLADDCVSRGQELKRQGEMAPGFDPQTRCQEVIDDGWLREGSDIDAVLRAAAGTSTTTTAAPPTTTTTEPPRTFTRQSYTELVTDPDHFKGSTIDVVGKVFGEVSRQGGVLGFQMFAIPEQSEGNTVVFYIGDAPITGGDFVHVVGAVKGKFEGSNAFGGTITAVQVQATKVEKVDALAAAAPAQREVRLNATQTQNGLSIKVKAVQYAERETRVLLTVINNSKSEASFYRSGAKAVQGAKQFDTIYSSDYPEVQSTILPGVTSDGVLLFPAMNPKAPTSLVLEGRTSDYRVSFQKYSFSVPGG